MSNCITPTQLLKKEIVNSFFEYFVGQTENNWFLGMGNPIPWAFDQEQITSSKLYLGKYVSNLEYEDQIVPANFDTDEDKYNFYRTCTALKKITSEDVSFLVEKNPWQQNTVYQPYRHDQEMFLPGKKFYIYNPENRCVYKCIENDAFGVSAGSGITEGGSQYAPFSTSTEIIDTQDGYKWKLIYQVGATDELKFSVNGRTDLDSFIPVKYINYDPDTADDAGNLHKSVQDAAVNGSLSSIYVNPFYKNIFSFDRNFTVVGDTAAIYLESDVAVGATNVRVNYFYGDNNSSANSLRDMLFYVISGPGSGQARPIKSSTKVSSSGVNYFDLNIDALDVGLSGFDGDGSESSKINILPYIKIFGDGESNDPTNTNYSTLEKALALPKFDSNEILKSTDLLDIGKNYTYASASIPKGLTSTSSSFTSVPEDLLSVSLSPFGGHGSNAITELGASRIVIKTKFTGNENNKLNPTNDFRQIAIIKNPLLAKSKVRIRTVDGIGGSVATGDSATLTGSGVTAYGIVSSTYEYTSGSHEYIVSSLSGDVTGNYEYIDTDSSAGSLQIDPYDGVDFVTIAGRENRISRVLTATGTINTGGNNVMPRDFAVGYGNKSLGISPSFATGRVLQISSTNAAKVTIENINGSYLEGEVVRTFTRGGTSSGSFTISEISDYASSVLESVYNMTTTLYVTSQSGDTFVSSSFLPDQIIYSFENNSVSKPISTTEFKKNAYVFDWSPNLSAVLSGSGGGLTNDGVLEVVGAKPGDFEAGDYILYYKNNVAKYAIINNVVEPEILYGTGEVVYVQNFSGIERYSNNEEEINLVIGL